MPFPFNEVLFSTDRHPSLWTSGITVHVMSFIARPALLLPEALSRPLAQSMADSNGFNALSSPHPNSKFVCPAREGEEGNFGIRPPEEERRLLYLFKGLNRYVKKSQVSPHFGSQ